MPFLEEFELQGTHRAYYLSELRTYIFSACNPSQGIPWHPDVIDIAIQYADPETPLPRLTAGVWVVEYDPKLNEPVHLELRKADAEVVPMNAEFLRSAEPDLANLIGAEPAAELTVWLIDLLDRHIAQLDTFYLAHARFRDMTTFNEVFLRLCAFIAGQTGSTFDRRAKLQEILDFWTETEGDVNVPGQLSWYAENGPAEGETQEQYDAAVADFHALVAAGIQATRAMLGAEPAPAQPTDRAQPEASGETLADV
jgi:hypothetical protein